MRTLHTNNYVILKHSLLTMGGIHKQPLSIFTFVPLGKRNLSSTDLSIGLSNLSINDPLIYLFIYCLSLIVVFKANTSFKVI